MTQTIEAPKTCADCPYFQNHHDRRGRGWCHLFDHQAREHHPLTNDCELAAATLEAREKEIELAEQERNRIESGEIEMSVIIHNEAQQELDGYIASEKPYSVIIRLSAKVCYNRRYDGLIMAGYVGFKSEFVAKKFAASYPHATVRKAKRVESPYSFEVVLKKISIEQINEIHAPLPTNAAWELLNGYGDYIGAKHRDAIKWERKGINPQDIVAEMRDKRPPQPEWDAQRYNPLRNLK